MNPPPSSLLSPLFHRYVVCGQVVLGSFIKEFNTPADSLTTMIRTILRDINYNLYTVKDIDVFFSSLFYISFTILFSWVVLNVCGMI